jgi:hypothetical protein
MYAQIRNVIARCKQCERVKTSFSFQQLSFSPLPIQGMNDALPTPQRAQMWAQVESNGRRKGRNTLPSSQHFEG